MRRHESDCINRFWRINISKGDVFIFWTKISKEISRRNCFLGFFIKDVTTWHERKRHHTGASSGRSRCLLCLNLLLYQSWNIWQRKHLCTDYIWYSYNYLELRKWSESMLAAATCFAQRIHVGSGICQNYLQNRKVLRHFWLQVTPYMDNTAACFSSSYKPLSIVSSIQSRRECIEG